MKTISEESPYYVALIDLINSIGNDINLPDEDKVLMMFHLNTEEKISTFNKWVKTKLDGEHIVATPKEVMHQSAVISRMDI